MNAMIREAAEERQEQETAIVIEEAVEGQQAEASQPSIKKNNGFVVITLDTEFSYCGKKYKEFTLDFNNLQGADMEAVEAEMMSMGDVFTIETSASYLTKLAARAAGVGSDVISALPLKYYQKVKLAARNFLADMG